MKKILFLILIINLLNSCQSVSEGFTLKKDNADEFLVEKKNPLVLPPNYGTLPEPDGSGISNQKNENENFESKISTKLKSEDQNKKIDKSSSTKDFILKNIKKNEINK